MNKPITVKILVTVNDPAQFDACTLCFESLRVGWPTADIHVYINGTDFETSEEKRWRGRPTGAPATKPSAVEKLCDCHKNKMQNIFWHNIDFIHHAEWISREVGMHTSPGTLVIADADIVYWKSCEDWEFTDETLMAGYATPRMWNDFAKCVSVARIHTSMMVFPDPYRLWSMIRAAYPYCHKNHGDYCPCDPFMPRVMFDNAGPIFWDSCACLYHMLRSQNSSVLCYTPGLTTNQLECYDHLNSASFYHIMCERLEGLSREGFIRAHNEWVKNPTPGLWPLVDEYYEQKRIEGLVIENPSQIPTTKL